MPRGRPSRWTTEALIGAVLALSCAPRAAGALRTDLVRLPPGFRIEVFAAGVENARQMAWSPTGVLYVGSREAGKVHALPDRDGDWRADAVHVVAEGLEQPSGVAWRKGSLWVAEISRVLRFDRIDERYAGSPQPVVVSDAFPDETHHGWKFIAFGPDGRLYVPVGAPCNVCETEGLFGTITRMDPEGGTPEVVARGVRNSVGFDWHPRTGELWFTDNGRDRLGDDVPPDELNRVAEPGRHYGFPFCHGGDVPDPEYGDRGSCDEAVPPARKLGPHVAAIGMRFYTGNQFPAEYRDQIFIAEHGSWNRSEKIGYRVTLVRLDPAGTPTSYEPFAEGWLQGEEAWGRPADVLVAPDGSLLVADDHADAIYRIVYEGAE
jgi:glucose/arabinose dehydrogenase